MVNLTIIIPVFNTERYLETCLQSAIGIDVPDKEIILIDDGSTDGSGKIISDYCKRYDFLRCFTQENKGPGIARNIGLRHARGKYVLFLDSDDYILKNTIEKIFSVAESENLEVVHFDMKYSLDEFPKWNTKRKRAALDRLYSSPLKPEMVIRGNQCKLLNDSGELFRPSSGRYLLRSDLISRAGLEYPDTRSMEDEFFIPLILMNARSIRYVPIQTYFRRYREDSIMTCTDKDKDIRDLKSLSSICSRLYLYLKSHDLDGPEKDYLLRHIKFLYFRYISICKGIHKERLSYLKAISNDIISRPEILSSFDKHDKLFFTCLSRIRSDAEKNSFSYDMGYTNKKLFGEFIEILPISPYLSYVLFLKLKKRISKRTMLFFDKIKDSLKKKRSRISEFKNLIRGSNFLISFRIDDITFCAEDIVLLENAKDIARKYNITFDLAVIAEKFDLGMDKDAFSIYEKNKDIFEIVAHGLTHENPLDKTHNGEFRDLTADSKIPYDLQENHIVNMREIFEKHNLSDALDIFVVPWHAGDDNTVRIAEKYGYDLIVLSRYDDNFSIKSERPFGNIIYSRTYVSIPLTDHITDVELDSLVNGIIRFNGKMNVHIVLHPINFSDPSLVEKIVKKFVDFKKSHPNTKFGFISERFRRDRINRI